MQAKHYLVSLYFKNVKPLEEYYVFCHFSEKKKKKKYNKMLSSAFFFALSSWYVLTSTFLLKTGKFHSFVFTFFQNFASIWATEETSTIH